MLFRQSAKHDSYYISCEKNLEIGYYATLSTSVLGGGGSLHPLQMFVWGENKERSQMLWAAAPFDQVATSDNAKSRTDCQERTTFASLVLSWWL